MIVIFFSLSEIIEWEEHEPKLFRKSSYKVEPYLYMQLTWLKDNQTHNSSPPFLFAFEFELSPKHTQLSSEI